MNDDEPKRGIKMIEFFSGIGGMRYALEDALEESQKNSSSSDTTGDANVDHSKASRPSSLDSCIAYEISLYANQTYSLNFHEPISSYSNDQKRRRKENEIHSKKSFAIYTKLIEQLQPQDVHDVDLWTMSPPCQPFTSTRHAKQRDSADERCKGFKAIMKLLRTIHNDDNGHKAPRWILLENVKGFYGSDMLNQWYICLKECGYTWEEYLLNPTQIGIPNNRTRYYMVAERSNRFSATTNTANNNINHDDDDSIPTEVVPAVTKPIIRVPPRCCDSDDNDTTKIIQPLSEYIHQLDERECQKYVIPKTVFDKEWAKDIPVVCALDRITHCFTAAYSRQIHRATGSLLLMMNNDNQETRTHSIADEPLDRSDMTIYEGKIRRFTEYELLALFGFPSTFLFPDTLSLEHRYKLIGNSVNVKVISLLLRYLLLLE